MRTLERTTRRLSRSLGLAACAALCAVSCGREPRQGERAGPGVVGAGGADGGRQTFGGGGEGGSGSRRGDGPAAPRTIGLRSPFGNVEPGNLLMNGDFELGIGAVVPGWYAVADDHVMPFRYRTGGACRSGLLCAEIAAGQSLVATMVSLPRTGPATVTAHAKPRSGRFGDVTVRLTVQSLAGVGLGGVTLVEQGPPDVSGFVRYEASFEVDQPYDVVGLVVEARDSALVDDVSVRAGAPEPKRPFSWPRSHTIPESVDRVTRLAQAEARAQRGAPATRPATVAPPVAPLR